MIAGLQPITQNVYKRDETQSAPFGLKHGKEFREWFERLFFYFPEMQIKLEAMTVEWLLIIECK